MANHIATRVGTSEFDAAYLARRFAAMLKAMDGEEDEDAEDGLDGLTGEAEREYFLRQGYTKADLAGKRGKDDHRRDFADIAEGGADSAYGFDADALFQRVTS